MSLLSSALAGIGESTEFFVPVEDAYGDLPDDGWRDDDSQRRFVQFSFERRWFCMDLPRQTLHRPEAERLLRDRAGFFYVKDRPEFRLCEEDLEGYDPFRKIYVYGDERSAAEDMAFIFFDVWRFPVDWRFYVSAAAFGGNHRWERGAPVE